MEREIGTTGIKVHPVGFGVMPLSLATRPDEATALVVIAAGLDAGVTFLDTANAYCIDQNDTGHNERLIARALRKLDPQGRVTVGSKGGMTRPGGEWVTDGRPEALTAACEKSLRALDVETITLYQLHWPDKAVPYADSVGALARLQQQGKVRHVGVSNVSPAQLREAMGIVRVETVQNRLNPFDKDDLSNGLLPLCEQHGITYVAYAPVGGRLGHDRTRGAAVLTEIGRKYGVGPYRLALAWLLAKSPRIVPIPGASKVASIQDSARAAELEIAAEDLAVLDTL